METEIKHFSHEHPLILSGGNNDDDEKFGCKGCGQKILGSAYGCRDCSFFLHKICAKLPMEMEHRLHPQHLLTLLPQSPYHYRHYEFICGICRESSKAFTYHCSLCKFDLDISCAVRAQSIELEHHKHPLSPVLSPMVFKCHVCGIKREGVSYMCNTCSFWIHEECASLPATIKHWSHVHPLTLVDSFPFFEDFRLFQVKCGVCKEKLRRTTWIYICKGCTYYVHTNCSTKKKKRTTVIKDRDLDEAKSIHLPMPNESISLIDKFVKKISLEGDNKEKREEKLNHFSHVHPLVLYNAQSDNHLCSGSELSTSNKQTNDKICNACVRPISSPFYSCSLCNFFLHKWCADLPNSIQSPSHPHPLFLLKERPDTSWDLFNCEGCGKLCNGFAYCCFKINCGNTYVDVKCASLPSSIVHEVHEHPLLLRNHCISEGCAACPQRLLMFSFGCDICNFNLHYQCALLPRTVTHRYDKHPFILTYTPIEDGPDEYVCEFCEEDIDPQWWFYHCVDCDQSACAKCIYKGEKEYPNIKEITNAINDSDHPHPLSMVEPINKSTLCDLCCKDLSNVQIAFKCVQCNIMLHPKCSGSLMWVRLK
ncbi:E3 ubiquitin-protein ligase MID2 [Actinidia chinensis var. chinensis]|uniref:E3 ubiquitin-protein ligase MID2 n=1 Tax=Actinidia chinensis var. chinensis TaxID=1590841 RepID=A0A2R6QV75_ACTCC|nr:E3 ubiquitin-protein ligase MID2 [Actinidia chinensis var. chinensis]